MSILIESEPLHLQCSFPPRADVLNAPVFRTIPPAGPATRGSIVALDAVDAFAAFLNRRILAESARIAQAARSLTSI